MDKQILVGGLNASKNGKENNINNIEKPRKKSKRKTDKDIINKELKKMDNLPTSIPTEAKVEDGKVQLDMSSVFGPGTYAEIEGDDAERFIEEQKAPGNKLDEVKPEIKQNSENEDEEISEEVLKAGNPNCYAYLSLKATGIYKPDIISLGIVTEEGKSFYAEMKDIDIMKITPDTLVNIVQRRFNLKEDSITPSMTCIVGDANYIRSHLINWIREEYTDKGYVMQIISDKVSNEFGLFLELLLNGIPINQYSSIISPVCIDFNSVLASSLEISKPEGMSKEEFLKGYNPTHIALDIDRLSITEDETPREYLGNALVNAQAIRAAFRRLYNLDKDEEHVDLIKKKE